MPGDNDLSGGDGLDILHGGAGADKLIGGSGVDTLDGGTEDDTYYIDDADDIVIEARAEERSTASSPARAMPWPRASRSNRCRPKRPRRRQPST